MIWIFERVAIHLGAFSSQMSCCMTTKHLLPIAGHRAVPDCVKPAGGGGFAQLFFGAADCVGGVVSCVYPAK